MEQEPQRDTPRDQLRVASYHLESELRGLQNIVHGPRAIDEEAALQLTEDINRLREKIKALNEATQDE